jgi:hypothetical protein
MSGVETPQDNGVKDDFSIHVLKDVAIPSHGMGRDAPGKKNLRPAESAAVCGGKLQSKGLGFGADCKRSLAFAHSSRTETYGTRGGD